MYRRTHYILLIALFFIIGISQAQEKVSDFPVLKGPYLGQKPPGMKAEIFAPGIISSSENEVLFGIFKGGTIFFFERAAINFNKDWIYKPIYRTEMEDGKWTPLIKSQKEGKPWFYNYADAPIGLTILFPWTSKLDGSGPPKNIDIWRVIKTGNTWSEPFKLEYPINTEKFDSWPSLTKDNTLYFFSTREGGLGKADLYRSCLINGKYTEVENLDETINTRFWDHDPFIAPDESYLIWCSNQPDGFGGNDLYVAYRKQDGTWSIPKNMGNKINSAVDDSRPYVTPDGKYLFFNSNRTGNRDIYWVGAKTIEELKPDYLK